MKLRILHFVTDLDRHSGGPSVSVPALCRHLGELEGLEIHLATRRTENPIETGNEDRFQIHWIDGSRRSIRDLFQELANEPILLQLNGLWDPMLHRASVEAQLRVIPIVHSIRGMLEPWALAHKRWKKKLGWWAYQKRDLQHASILHGSSDQELASLDRVGFGNVAHIALPNGVAKPENLDSILSEESKTRTLQFLGRLHPVKGLEPLIDAWAVARPPGWELQITGPGETRYREELEKRVSNHGLASSIRFSGAVDGTEKWRTLARAGCLILPSHSENFGMVVAEALQTGTPVAASQGTPWQILETERAGWWIKADSEGIGDFLKDLEARSPEELGTMGARGRELVEREYSWDSIAQRFAEVYRKLAQSNPAPNRK